MKLPPSDQSFIGLTRMVTLVTTELTNLSGIPAFQRGNLIEISTGMLGIEEACSGIRSLLTLTFLSLVYGYFLEKRTWVRVVLFFSTIPIAVIANAGRVTLTGVIASFRPDLAEGLFHEAQGWVIFMVALVILIAFHQSILVVLRMTGEKKAGTESAA